LSSLHEQALVLPEVRQDRVNALCDAIQSGQYKVDPQKIAEAIIEENEG